MDAPSSAIAAHDIAQACAQAMWAEDQASQGLGMVVERVAPGEAVLSMLIRPDMTNGHGICHGGFIFTLADSAFAFACNTYDQRTVAQQCNVTFLQPGRRGDMLTAHAVERNRSGRSGIYDVTVRNGQGEVVAEFRGHSRTISGTLLASGADETEPTRT
ncbi:hydroxyphenylacetyl-CoA thioesterase PaaI [Microvirga arabica]|uniref:Hydroxyphenylacetyl-CoA thioesterase PaaI n=1 Tax=Microvirga arabica TaxID=1128671 RepID=A0ABV6YGF2_9HYPH|nr:hydroxyphenylacetyl-CoA thioesterase PaaI [Microvirga arabica]MBM1169479.1 hydroxyphenylacetyl-CoA thioesterase PaaI [Microvirga arabica]